MDSIKSKVILYLNIYFYKFFYSLILKKKIEARNELKTRTSLAK